jgi:hypothetical protein
VNADIEGRLAELAGLMRESELLQRRRAELDTRRAEQAGRLTALRDAHASEVRDVERLEKLSLTRVLVALRGSQAEDLARETAEAETARYRVAEGESRLAALEAELAAVTARLQALADLPVRYAAALDDKDDHLRRSGDPSAPRLMALAEGRGRAEAELRELAEAAAAADTALGALGEVRRQLDRVSRMKADDNWLGGAVVLSNPNWLDPVGWAAAQADRCTAVLHTELADVGLARPLGSAWAVVAPIGVTGGLFEQAFLSDLIARDRINHAIRSVDHTAQLVVGVRAEIAERTRLVEAHRAAVSAERHAILTSR